MKQVAICSASNQTYVLGVAAALVSAVLNAPRDAKCRVYVLDGGIRDNSWRKLERTMAGLPRSCELIRLRPDMGSYAGLPQDWGNSVMAYARLALPQMVTEPRVLYVDADLLVQADWESLWEMDLGDAVIAAAPDIVTKTLGAEWWADQGIENCVIGAPVLHFVGPNKPWIYGFHTQPSGKLFFGFLDQTAWKGWRPNGLRFACKMAKYRVSKFLNALRALVRRG